MSTSAKLIFFCGKMAAGKSTLARDLARRENAVLLRANAEHELHSSMRQMFVQKAAEGANQGFT